MKQIKDLGEKEVILCKTRTECEAITNLLDKEKYLTASGRDYKQFKNSWNGLLTSFGFCPFYGTFDEGSYFINKNYTIHNAKDFIVEKQVSSEVKEELQDILKEWTELKFQKGLNLILRERLK